MMWMWVGALAATIGFLFGLFWAGANRGDDE